MGAASFDSDLLQRYLAKRDASCPRCGYNLRGLHGQTCPECGEALQLHVGLVHPKQGALITGLIGLAAGVGLNGLLLIYAAVIISRNGFDGVGFRDSFLIVTAGGLAIEGVALTAWLFRWRRIYRLNTTARRSLAAACWLLTGVNIIIFSFTMR